MMLHYDAAPDSVAASWQCHDRVATSLRRRGIMMASRCHEGIMTVHDVIKVSQRHNGVMRHRDIMTVSWCDDNKEFFPCDSMYFFLDSCLVIDQPKN
uniref:Uncharacterized protein n=1 Tax=Acrobeloides nanus TaxID=290746 RepID=A0A914CE09_9BILA